jgi:hypothetical protein
LIRDEQSQQVEEIVTPPVAELQTVSEARQDGPVLADIYQAQPIEDMNSQYEMGVQQGQWTNAAYLQQFVPQGQPIHGLPVGYYHQPLPVMPYVPQYWHSYNHPQNQQPGQLPTPSTSPPKTTHQYNHGPVTTNTAQKVRKPAEDKKHPCGVCGKKFLRPSALIAHQTIHTGETPYRCPIVDCTRHSRGFSVKSNMVRHCRNGHVEHAEFLAQHKIYMNPKGKGTS